MPCKGCWATRAAAKPHETALLRARRAGETRSRHDLRLSMRTVSGIYRYPIKGLSPERVNRVELLPGKPFPFDRAFALLRPGDAMDPTAPCWAKKGHFLMLMLEDSLARVRTHLDPATLQFSVSERRFGADASAEHFEEVLRVDLGAELGRAAVENYFRWQVPGLVSAPKLIHSPDGHFMDKPDPVMSCINLETVRSLERDWGHSVHPLRFRANFYIEGGRAWEEFDWIGHDISLGGVVFHADRRNGRCGATNVNPLSGERDRDIPGALRKTLGHKDLGIYLTARTAGGVHVGDAVSVPELGPGDARLDDASPSPEPGTFICRGCYYVYRQSRGAAGVAAGTPFAAIDSAWRCPDCGIHKGNFLPT